MQKTTHIRKFLLSTCFAASFTALPTAGAETLYGSHTGRDGNYYFSSYKTSPGTSSITLGTPSLPGNFAASWNDVQNVVIGKGWNPGDYKGTVNYNCGYFSSTDAVSSTLGLYGWTVGPAGISYVSEYYVVDTWTGARPVGDGRKFATIWVDGAYYDIYKNFRDNKPSIAGDRDFWQYYSVRQTKRALKNNAGQSLNLAITLQPHFTAWSKIGLVWNRFDYQLVGIEAQDFSGVATATGGVNITVW